MKIKHYIFSLLAASLVLTGCGGDFINLDNPNQMTSNDFFSSEKDMDEAITACYGSLYFQGIYSQWYDLVFEMRGDLCYNESAWQDYNNSSKFIFPNNDWEYVHYVWNDYYKGINMINRFLTHIDDKNIQMDETKRTQYKGEASFLRALYYFNLYHLYGDVPVVTEPFDEVSFPERATDEEVWAQIAADLQTALDADLPWKWSGNDLGRIGKGAVYAMIGKMHMQRHEWQEAADAFKAIIDSNQFKLVDNYSDNFDLEHEFNSESIFEVSFYDDGTKGTWTEYGSARSIRTSQRAKYFAPRSVGGHSDAQPNNFYLNEFTDKTKAGKEDPRKRASILYYPTDRFYGKTYLALGGTVKLNSKTPMIWSKKYSNGYWRGYEDEWSGINLRVIRYADILLMYAEALNNLGQTHEAYQYIDQVRQRKSVDLVTLESVKPNMTQQEMQKQIEHERITELGGESERWFDLWRWGYLDTEEGKEELEKHDYEFETFRPGISKLLPIPQADVDLDKNLKQNPGY